MTLPSHAPAAYADNERRQRFFSEFRAASTALLVIDMQNHWVHSKGCCYVATAADVVPNINRLAMSLREAGGLVVWVRSTLALSGERAWRLLYDEMGDERTAAQERAELIAGHPMHALWSGLALDAADWHVEKSRFSAFVGASADFDARLRAHGIDTVIVTGVATNICCESTARDAMMRDYRTVMVTDGNAARTGQDHAAGLWTFAQVFGAALSTAEVTARIRRRAPRLPPRG